jgi:c-di-GMP-binding flagellar brake protein YcgR
MIVLNEEKLTLLFGEIAKGFVKSPLEIALFIVLVGGILTALVLLYGSQAKKAAVVRALRAQEIFDRIVRKRSFTGDEVALLVKLSSYLDDPADKHLLFERRSTFNRCVERMRKKEPVPAPLLASLRGKLAFTKAGPAALRSSRQLPRMQPVVVMRVRGSGSTGGGVLEAGRPVVGREDALQGRVEETSGKTLQVSVTRGYPKGVESWLRSGAPVQVYFKNPSGIFFFASRVHGVEGNLLHLSHAEQVKRLQRRRFFRKKTALPVFIRPAPERGRHVEEEEWDAVPRRTAFVDLGGGGAALINPQRAFGVGDRIELFFHIVGRKPQLRVTGEVIRASDQGGKIHVLFDSMPEASRDRIIRFLRQKV